MRILHFYKTYFPDTVGGTEQFIFQLAHGCVNRGIDVEVLSLSKTVRDDTRQVDNHRGHRIRRDAEIASTGMSLAAFGRFRSLAADADVIHLHYPWPFGDLVHLLAAVSKPTVLTYHSDIIRQRWLAKLYAPLQERFLRSVDKIVATSPNYLESSDTLRRHRDRTTVIPIGLDRTTYPKPDRARLAKWRAMFPGRFFLFVGVLRYYKGLHVLLEALRGTDYLTVIVGAGPIEQPLQSHAKRLGLSNVRFLGAVSDEDKVALLELSQSVVFPSHLRSEAFGISLLEGAMFGKPMISSEIGTGTSFVNIHNETGLVVAPNDPDALRQALVTMQDNPGLAEQMGANARLRYARYFTADRMVDSYLALYQELLFAHCGAGPGGGTPVKIARSHRAGRSAIGGGGG
ncbi:glycosyltransferase family 4 protein [Bradyrhizobium sp. HKCCYLS2038]|uniref:glycosyltransferase family 4 protein n=1 Tax=unclassified Bradyrhizobium TaxID=2631580 RepID=UPI003EC0D330